MARQSKGILVTLRSFALLALAAGCAREGERRYATATGPLPHLRSKRTGLLKLDRSVNLIAAEGP